MVQVDMHASHNVALEIVLNVSKFPREIRHMVVIDEGNGRHRFFILIPFLAHKTISNQVSNRLGAIGVLSTLNQVIEIDEQMLIERDAESDELLQSDPSVARITNP